VAQVKIYGLRSSIDHHRIQLSAAIHQSIVEALSYPPDKRFHRFIGLAPEEFLFPSDRTTSYTIIEVSLFEGRSVGAKKSLIRALYTNIEQACGISPQDIEITLTETPKSNWGIRGKTGDELALGYKVDV